MLSEMIANIRAAERIDASLAFDIVKNANQAERPDLDSSACLREILIYVFDNWEKATADSKEIWADLAESCGFYPYINKYGDDLQLESTAALIRHGYHKSDNLDGYFFHEEQKELLENLGFGKNLIVSAPTSFGKSLLIEEVIASKRYRNIVVIQPTLALLDETRQKLSKYRSEYKIIVKTTQTASTEKGNIFLLTAERVLEYPNLPAIDFLVLDEFYKLSSKRDDERSDILNNALYLLLRKHRCRFLFLGPNIEGISEGFAESHNAVFHKTNYSLVASEEVNIYQEYTGRFGPRGEKKAFKEKVLFDLLYDLKDEQTIVFCSSPARVRYLSKQYMQYLKTKTENGEISVPLIEWIEKNVHRQWCLTGCLKNRIGIHDGALPRHITSSIIDYFNGGILNTLFCTTTIIEGVNTSAKNIIYFDSTKGNHINIDYFDYSNIKGRAGRMMVHFVGKIYNFNRPPAKEDVIVDIPFFEQNPISDEVLINIDAEEKLYPESDQNKYLDSLPADLTKIIKRNGVNVKGQVAIANELNQLPNMSLVSWRGFPTYEQLQYTLSLAWNHLIKPGETVSPMTLSKLTKMTFDYGQGKTLSQLIESNYKYYRPLARYNGWGNVDVLDEAIKDAFQVLRHWFEYKVPKWLTVIHSLQEYVCTQRRVRPGSYLHYSNLIENNLLPSHLTLLLEYNIPVSAINKIKARIPETLNDESLIDYIQANHLVERSGLIEYERSFFE